MPLTAPDAQSLAVIAVAVAAGLSVAALQWLDDHPYRCPRCGSLSCTQACEQPTDD